MTQQEGFQTGKADPRKKSDIGGVKKVSSRKQGKDKTNEAKKRNPSASTTNPRRRGAS